MNKSLPFSKVRTIFSHYRLKLERYLFNRKYLMLPNSKALKALSILRWKYSIIFLISGSWEADYSTTTRIPPKPSLIPKVYMVKIKDILLLQKWPRKNGRVYISLVFSSSLRYKNKFCLIHMYQARKHMKQPHFD